MNRIARPALPALAAMLALAVSLASGCRGVGGPAPVGSAAPVAAPAQAAPAAPVPPPAPATASPAPVASGTEPAAVPVDPPGTADIVQNHCLTCHSEDLLRQQRLTGAQWKKTIDKMQTWGATIAPGRVEGLAAYLARQYGTEAGPYAAESRTALQVAAMFEPHPVAKYEGGDAARGVALYADRCQPCHEEAGRGGAGSITIVGRSLFDRPAELADLIRAGRGDMPSFDETTDAEIADLLAYLRSLPSISPESAPK